MFNLNFTKLFCIFIIFLIFFTINAQIHRAKSPSSYHLKYDSNYTKTYQISQQQSQDEDPIVHNYLTWLFSTLGILSVGLSGVLPVLILPHLAKNHDDLIHEPIFKYLLAFAAGSLIGDVFIHLLPETYTAAVLNDHDKSINIGIWTIFGISVFMIIEKVFPDDDDDNNNKEHEINNKNNKNNRYNKYKKGKKKKQEIKKKELVTHTIKIMGILNLVANIVDNFTHGIAVAGSFQASHKFGVMTLIATLVHEIPHEIGDFVILLKSGFSYLKATFLQLATALAGLIGAIFALSYTSAEEAGNVTSWILPFTSGGFLYISLVGIVPDLVKERDTNISFKQIISFIFGILFIYVLASVFE